MTLMVVVVYGGSRRVEKGVEKGDGSSISSGI